MRSSSLPFNLDRMRRLQSANEPICVPDTLEPKVCKLRDRHRWRIVSSRGLFRVSSTCSFYFSPPTFDSVVTKLWAKYWHHSQDLEERLVRYNMTSLLALLTQRTPNLQTRKGLILLGLQNDFLSPDGKLRVSTTSGFLDRLKELVPAFREFGDAIWVRSEFEANRVANVREETGDTVITGSVLSSSSIAAKSGQFKRKASQDALAPLKRVKAVDAEDDEELFLRRTADREPCCLKGSLGAEYPTDIKSLVDEKKDLQVVKTYYSAFGSTSLLLTLRSRLITELFVCGVNTNLSVFATAMDAARYGIKITLIEDCLGYRKRERHDEAIRQLVNIMGADVMSSKRALNILRNPPTEDDVASDGESETESEAVGFGEDAARVDPNNLVAADSDEEDEEEELVLPNVRSSPRPERSLAYRSLPTMGSRSHSATATTEPISAAQHAESASARLSDPGSVAVRDCEPSCRPSDGHGSRDGAKRLQSTLAGGTSHCSIVDSSTKPPPTDESRVGTVSNTSLRAESDLQPLLPVIDSPLVEQTSPESQPPHCARSKHTTIANGSPEERPLQEYREDGSTSEVSHAKGAPLFGKNTEHESAGSSMLHDLLPLEIAETVCDELINEVEWQRMHHQTGEVPRLVCCQGNILEDGSRPVYRHPSDQTLALHTWSTTVAKVRKAAEEAVGHPLNHALIQLYRGGLDYISEHSDKTLDIVQGSNIVNVSLGAQRTMRLRTKRAATQPPATAPAAKGKSSASPARTTHRIPMPHNSMIAMSLATNAQYLHGINADKRPAVEQTEAEKAYGGKRISLTFRHIGTFLTADGTLIWGQGATSKMRERARPAMSGVAAESEKLVRAFSAENQASSIDWQAVYGEGSDVLHLKSLRSDQDAIKISSGE